MKTKHKSESSRGIRVHRLAMNVSERKTGFHRTFVKLTSVRRHRPLYVVVFNLNSTLAMHFTNRIIRRRSSVCRTCCGRGLEAHYASFPPKSNLPQELTLSPVRLSVRLGLPARLMPESEHVKRCTVPWCTLTPRGEEPLGSSQPRCSRWWPSSTCTQFARAPKCYRTTQRTGCHPGPCESLGHPRRKVVERSSEQLVLS